jgi:hypothetical protein
MPLTKIQALQGGVNTGEEAIVRHVRLSIRRQLPQCRPYQTQPAKVAILGGGPSLADTGDELRRLVFQGVKVVAVNGAYQWAIDRNIKPSVAIALDARPENAAFFATDVPGCQYLIASQCAPAMFDALEGRDVSIWHALSYEAEEAAALDAYYGREHYWPVQGGSTVMLRAISLMRMLGFHRQELFGFDSCWLEGRHHAFDQPMNDADHRLKVYAGVDGSEDRRVFYCAPWHLKQAQDFEELTKARGHLFQLNVHGNGLIAHLVRTGARVHEERDAGPGAGVDDGACEAASARRGEDHEAIAVEDRA